MVAPFCGYVKTASQRQLLWTVCNCYCTAAAGFSGNAMASPPIQLWQALLQQAKLLYSRRSLDLCSLQSFEELGSGVGMYALQTHSLKTSFLRNSKMTLG